VQRSISQLWMYKWRNFASPGPINNAELLCPHRNIQRDLNDIYYDRVEEIPDSIYQKLKSGYGGTALNDDSESLPPVCSICLDHAALRLRRKTEKRRILELDRSELRDNDEVWFIISEAWLQEWRDFVISEKKRIASWRNFKLQTP